MLVHVKNGHAIKLEIDPNAPMARDKLCWQSEAGLERLYHPDRLRFPLKRTGERGEGKWQRITWEEALGTIAEKFKAFKDKNGAESVALVKGYYERRCDLVSRLGNAFGTPNIVGIDNTCYIPSASGRLMTYGFDGRPDLSGLPDCVLCWGSGANPPVKDGAKLIVVNSIRTEAAKRADIWLQPKPATDLALALGMLNVIITEKLYDKAFVDEWTTGFSKLEKHVQAYPPDKISEITWIEAEKVVAAARLFAGSRYACLMNGNASEDTYNSTQFARAVSMIQAICGLLDIPGGTIQLQYLVKSILEGTPYEVQAALVVGCNPVMTWCNSRRVYDAFKKLNFLAVADLVITPTASLADIILPSASSLEADAVLVKGLGMGDTCLQAQQKVVQIEECRSDLEIVISLAEAMALGEYFWTDLHSYLDAYLEKVGITFEELRRRDRIISSGISYRKYLEKGFNTPSGKVEIYSSLCEEWGYEPLPVYHEPRETPCSAPELAETYPLILTSAHDKVYVHSQDRNLETLRKRNPQPLVLIHPDTADKIGISEGDQVNIENKRGRITQTATLSEAVDPRVICVAYGWWFPENGASGQYGWDGANINILTDDSPPYSPEIGSPSMRGFLCRVYKAEP
jgi:anaerobic selenocysteine-containing dehydrogenase